MFGPYNAVQTPSYAPLVRGAPSMSEVVISDGPIDFPRVVSVDILLALGPQACVLHGADVRPGGAIVVESGESVRTESVPKIETNALPVRVYRLPLADTADRCGAPPAAAGLVGLATVARLCRLVGDEALRRAVSMRVPRDARASNLTALEAGFRLADACGATVRDVAAEGR